MLNKIEFFIRKSFEIDTKIVPKVNKHVEQNGTCDFSVFAKCITLKSFFGRIATTKMYEQMNKNRNEITD